MKITGKPYLAIRRRKRQQQLEHSWRILSSSSSQSLPLCSCVSVCWVFYLFSTLLYFPLLFVFSAVVSTVLSSSQFLRKVMDMPAFSEFFTDFGFFFFCRDCWVYDQSPTLTRNGEDHGYIRMDKYLHWYEAFWGIAQEQNHEGLGPKWTISYQCGDTWCP